MNALQQALTVLDSEPADPLDQAKARALMIGYDARWKNAGFVCEAKELQFTMPVLNPATRRKSRTWTNAGKYDGLVSRNGEGWLLEHKTTSDDLGAESTYWKQLAIDSQVSHYMLARWQEGQRLVGTLYDVIRKPTINPKKLTKADQQLFVAGRTYYGQRFDDAFVSAWQRDPEARETPEMYGARLTHDCTVERPEWYFQRQEIPRLDRDIIEYAGELWEVGQQISAARKSGVHYRNSGACAMYGRPCEFLGICSGYDTPESDRWQPRQLHSELDLDGDSGRDVLTNSRIRCFQTCRRKHFYRYELGIERRDDEQAAALRFGSLMHLALEAWWSFFFFSLEKDHGDSNRSQQPSEPDDAAIAIPF